jgi:hypothetical protein
MKQNRKGGGDWKVKQTKSGRPYWVHRSTGEETFENPYPQQPSGRLELAQPSENISVSEGKLTPAQINEINARQKMEIDNPDNNAEKTRIQNEMNKLRTLDGKERKMIVSAIASYNMLQRRMDNLNFMSLTRKEKSTYPCGTVTCKTRGKKIKEALLDISKIDESALGEIGLLGLTMSNTHHVVTRLADTVGTNIRKQTVVPNSEIVDEVAPKKRWWGGRTRRRR